MDRFQPIATAAVLVVLILISAPQTITAQDMPTLTRTMGASVFGGYVNVAPDYGQSRDSGFALGLDCTRYFSSRVIPSLEARADLASGRYVNEKSYIFGPKVEIGFARRYHPYADFLIGFGTIHFVRANAASYHGDNSLIYSPGGGVDIDITNNLQTKIDYQRQFWDFGHGPGLMTKEFTLNPSLLIIGLQYRISFRSHTTQSTRQH